MKYIGLSCFSIAFVAAVFALGFWSAGNFGPSKTSVWSTGPTVTHLESLSALVTTRVYVADVLIAEGSGHRGSWLIKGDALIGIDLSESQVVEKDDEKRTAVILLPAPHVISARVDHERTRTWNVEKTTWIPFAGNEDEIRDKAMHHAQKLVDHAAASQGNIDHASHNTQNIVNSVYKMVDWSVAIRWE